jgi:hypothetical protein
MKLPISPYGVLFLWSIMVLLVRLPQVSTVEAQSGGCSAPPLVCMASRNQDLSLSRRDLCRYEQRARVELYKRGKSNEAGKLDKVRETRVVVEPSATPDETGQYPVNTRVVEDTDDKGQPKKKVDPNARTGLASGAFLDLLFFPLLPEKLNSLEFEEISSDMPNEKLFVFRPKPGTKDTVASGQVYINAQTGAVLTVKIDGLYNLKAFDKILDKLEKIYATIDYSEFDGKYRMPALAKGGGLSDVTKFKGVFQFTFEESRYVQVLKLN